MKRGELKQRTMQGFTLVELIVTMVISAIVVGMAAMFMTAPVDAYINQSERAVLNESAETISRLMAEDLRTALPNSVRIRNSGTRAIVELLRVEAVSFYRGSGSLAAVPIEAARELDFALADTQFTAFGRVDPTRVATYDFPGRLVISNRGAAAAVTDAYRVPPATLGVITPAATTIRITPNLATREDAIQLIPGYRFRTPVAPPQSRDRLFFVSGPVTYICNSTAGTRALRRYSNYPITAAIATAETSAQLAGATNTLLANNVASCRLRCLSNAAIDNTCATALVVEITVDRTIPGGTEPIRIFEQFPVDNST